MTPARGGRLRVAAGLLLVLAVAWSVPAGEVSEDTKNDLYVDPWGFLARALHLWDPQVTWGVLQNQGYGYLFPMGPVIGALSEVVPVWVAQRLWWSLLLAAGFLATHALLRALGVGSAWTRVVAAVAYTLAPRVLSTIGGLSSEALPVLLAPAVLLPVVLAARGGITTRRAAALSGLAVLCCGGVNATATLLATVPTGLFLVTRTRWWRESLTWWWAGCVVAATAWWVGPLLVLGRWSPPFLDWIERSADVVRDLDALDVVSGSTHWLQLVVTGAGPWWPAGHQLATTALLVVLTVAVGAVGLAGLGLPGLPERRWLVLCAGLGAALLLVAHRGPVGSPLADVAQDLYDGPLVAFRNIHKADPLVRLPLAVGLAHALHVLAAALDRRLTTRVGLRLVVVAATVAVVSPGLSGAIAPPGTFTGMARQWVEAGGWLSARADLGRALVVPASSFGEYVWGRTIDEPIRPLSTADHAVRDAVPLTPAGTIRFLDDVERGLQTGDSLGARTEVLRRLGVRWLVVRNDLDPRASGQPTPAVARSAVRSTPGVSFVRGFGTTLVDASGERVFPVEVYDLGAAAPLAVTQPLTDVVAVAGGAEDLARVLESGESGLVVLDVDRPGGLDPGRRVVTDGDRARARAFGAPRGRDASSTLTADEVDGTRDYRPRPGTRWSSTVTWSGIAGVTASSSVATEYTFAGLRPADRPAAALDDDPATAWTTFGDPRPTIDIDLGDARDVGSVRLVALDRPSGPTRGVGVPTRLRVTSDRGARTVVLGEAGTGDVALPPGATSRVRVEVLDTDEGAPASVVTGLATVRLEGVEPVEIVRVPESAADGTADTVLLDGGLPAVAACVHPDEEAVCLGAGLAPEGGAVMARSVVGAAAGAYEVGGTLVPDSGAPEVRGLGVDGVEVRASSRRTDAPGGRAEGAVDGDPATAWSPASGDRAVALDVRFDTPVDVAGLRLDARDGWTARHRPVVTVSLDGEDRVVRASADGHLAVAADGVREVRLGFLATGGARLATDSLELEELEVLGVTLPRPSDRVLLPCGEGPDLSVGGRAVATRADGPRSALWGVGRMTWTACAPVELDTGALDVIVRGTFGWSPATAELVRSGRSVAGPAPVPADVSRRGPTRLVGSLDAGPRRLLALDLNANPGWEATLAGRALDPVTVDGFRQGYVVPGGASGALEVRFAPDAPYRAALLVGALLAALVVACALAPGGGRRVVPASHRPRVGPWGLRAVVVAGALTLTGPWGALAAVAALAVGGAGRVRRTAPWLGAGLCVAAALVVAVSGTGLRTPEGAQVAAALLVTAGASLVASARVAPPTASRAARRSGGSPMPAPARPADRVPAGGRTRR